LALAARERHLREIHRQRRSVVCLTYVKATAQPRRSLSMGHSPPSWPGTRPRISPCPGAGPCLPPSRLEASRPTLPRRSVASSERIFLMSKTSRCRCDSVDHGHPKDGCPNPPRAAGDGLCKECFDKISGVTQAIQPSTDLPPGTVR
jgi:hypothetical protein